MTPRICLALALASTALAGPVAASALEANGFDVALAPDLLRRVRLGVACNDCQSTRHANGPGDPDYFAEECPQLILGYRSAGVDDAGDSWWCRLAHRRKYGCRSCEPHRLLSA